MWHEGTKLTWELQVSHRNQREAFQQLNVPLHLPEFHEFDDWPC
jgi:hypothetical protein